MKKNPYDYYNSLNLPIQQIKDTYNSLQKEEQHKIYLYLISVDKNSRKRAYALIEANKKDVFHPVNIPHLQIDKFRNNHIKQQGKDVINTLLDNLLSEYTLPITLEQFTVLFENSVDIYTLDILKSLPLFQERIMFTIAAFKTRLVVPEPNNKSVNRYESSFNNHRDAIVPQLQRAGLFELADNLQLVAFSGEYMNTHIKKDFEKEIILLFSELFDTSNKKFFDDVKIDFNFIQKEIVSELTKTLL